jgi:hypothetical protein
MTYHDRYDADTKELHLPMSHVVDLFKYVPNSKVGYMVNFTSYLNGKIDNFVRIFFAINNKIRMM